MNKNCTNILLTSDLVSFAHPLNYMLSLESLPGKFQTDEEYI